MGFKLESSAGLPELLAATVVPLAIAIPLYLYGVKVHRDGGSPKTKWLFLIPLALGAIWGYRYFAFITDAFNVKIYKESGLMSSRGQYAHYAPFVGPIIGMIALAVAAVLDNRARERY